MSGPIKLIHPVDLKNVDGDVVERITEVTLRRLKGRDLKTLDTVKGSGSMVLRLIAVSAGLPPSTVEEFDVEDITALGEVVTGFIGGALPTGAT